MIGTQLAGGQFQILSKLGAGGFASVYRGSQQSPRREVAIKVLHESLSNQQDVVTRFHHEAQTLAAFDHPNIMKIYFEGQEGGAHYFVANLLREDLRNKLDRTGLLPLEDALRILRQITEALGYMHRKGFVHRDFKPANILFDEGDNAVLTDFGLARGAELSMVTQPGMVLGTAAYMAPEQIQGGSKGVGPAADLYALGCVMYEVLEGRPPFPSSDFFATCHSHLYETVPPMRNPELSPGLGEVVEALLAKKPEERPASTEVVLEELRAAELEIARTRGRGSRTGFSSSRPPSPAAPEGRAGATSMEQTVIYPREGAPGAAEPDSNPSASPNPQWSMAADAAPPPERPAPPMPDRPASAAQAPAPTPSPGFSGEWPAHEDIANNDVKIDSRPQIPPPGRARSSSKPGAFPAWIAFVVVSALAVGAFLIMKNLPQHPAAGQPTAGLTVPAGNPSVGEGTAILRVSPPGAIASLDGRPLPGPEPYIITAAEGAPHEVSLSLSGYVPKTIGVRTRADKQDTIRVQLQPSSPSLTTEIFAAPAQGTIPRPGHTPREHAGTGAPVPEPPRPMERTTGVGRITVTASPFVVSLTLDGGDSELQTPCTFEDVTAGVHRILVSKSGYSLKSAVLNDTPLQVSGDELSVVVKPKLTQRLQLVLEKN